MFGCGMKIRERVIISVLAALAVLATTGTALAADYPPGPGETAVIYDGISLFKYYSMTVGRILSLQSDEAAGNLDKMVYANLPEITVSQTSAFTANMKAVGYDTRDIDSQINPSGRCSSYHSYRKFPSNRRNFRQNCRSRYQFKTSPK